MGTFISRWLTLSVAAGVMVWLLPDSAMQPVGDNKLMAVLAFALFMALINASIKPVVHMLALPFSLLSFGLIALIINVLFMRFASWLAVSVFGTGIWIHGFLWAVVGSFIMAVVSGIVSAIIGD